MANLFITNETGYIESAVAEQFKSRGCTVTALPRSDKQSKKSPRAVTRHFVVTCANLEILPPGL